MNTKRNKLFQITIVFLLIRNLIFAKKLRHYYHLTLSVRNHNITDAKFFRLYGAGHTIDFNLAPGNIFTKTYQVN